MLKTVMTATLAVATLAGASLATTGSAEARWSRGGYVAGGVAAGLLGGALLGGAFSPAYGQSYGPTYYEAPQRVYVEPACYWRRERVWDGYAWRIERVQVCR